MSGYISQSLRARVAARAKYRCEYCGIAERDAFYPFQIDHIISRKHGGPTDFENLALSCFVCNNTKGRDIGTILLPDRAFVRLFDPRRDRGADHFEVEHFQFSAKTDIGEATIKVLQLNLVERIIERQWLE